MRLLLLSSLCLLSLLHGQETPSPTPPRAPADIRPENAMGRIKARNLFHPQRGVLPEGAAFPEAQSEAWPLLVGTARAGKDSYAMLRLGSTGEGTSLKAGEAFEGFEVIAVDRDRVQLRRASTGESRWIDLDPPTEDREGPASEFHALLGGTRPVRGSGR